METDLNVNKGPLLFIIQFRHLTSIEELHVTILRKVLHYG